MDQKIFAGRVAVITGAATGIGRATVEGMIERGAVAVAIDRNGALLQEVCASLPQEQVRVFQADVADQARVEEIVAAVLAEFGKIDYLINNAGLWRRFIPFADTTPDMWKQFIDVNIYGTLYITHAVLPAMKEKQFGRIINLGSVAGVYGNGTMADYSLTKGAVIAFTKALAKEVGTDGITVNAVSPGMVSNEYNEIGPTDKNYLGRTCTHKENADLICYLASDEAAYISGQNIQIDGCRRMI